MKNLLAIFTLLGATSSFAKTTKCSYPVEGFTSYGHIQEDLSFADCVNLMKLEIQNGVADEFSQIHKVMISGQLEYVQLNKVVDVISPTDFAKNNHGLKVTAKIQDVLSGSPLLNFFEF